ncbi:UDP-glucose 4-epimerase [Catenibacillus scindens]|uniref:UDP-glucose 4-epimerase n=1 Tax=Catenibacillus scindens TaxID=673271 RepID=A0A7W8M467_9FIRM|nr:NAD(P)-dependent oxidoreductase [Catenibacillus scindens]MBB5262976.1 UDP-glucose 4-epimerase [Catenibacillus scindens]
MEILLTGNIGYLTERFILNTFPDCHVFIDGECGVKESKHISCLKGTKDMEKGELLEICDVDYVIYFSQFLTFHGRQTGELEQLRQILLYCQKRRCSFIYLTGPEGGVPSTTGKTIMASAGESLCRYYADLGAFHMKIVRIPYLYSAICPEDYLFHIFESARKEQKVHMEEAADGPACFLSMDDLCELLYRILDSWDEYHENEILNVPDVFSITLGQVGQSLKERIPGLEVDYGETWDGREENGLQPSAPDDKILRYRYGWFPKISLLTELSQLWEEYCRTMEKPERFWDKLKKCMKRAAKVWKVLETVGAFILMLILNVLLNNQVQFRFIDVRLLYVVIIGTIHGMNMGILAAALASVSLIFAYIGQGTNWLTLFYEPSNWLPFILYFTVGAICGYIQMKNRNDVGFVKKENQLLHDKFYFMQTLYQDTYRENHDLKRQILGSRDSFGKIYDITRKLDLVRPQEIFMQTIHILEDVLENHSIMIYTIGKNPNFARLGAASREILDGIPRSLDMKNYSMILSQIDPGNMWVNTRLDQELPMYVVGLHREQRLMLMIAIQRAQYTQMTLAYQNMIKILCGLVETALLRALDYQRSLYEQQHVGNTIFMKEEYFLAQLSLYHSMREEKMADYTLLRVDRGNMSLEEAEDILSVKIRETDTAGLSKDQQIYLILHQTTADGARHVCTRLEASGLKCTIVSGSEEGML